MFEKTLQDLIRGLRANKKNETKYISVMLEDIRKEIKSNDLGVKANAISKLAYLQMLGYDISFAAFPIIEVMSSAKFAHKRVGYLAAVVSFNQNTDVLMLATNLIKKDLASSNAFESSVALNGLSNFVNPDLARDLSSDVLSMLNHSKPFVRKKAVLTLYKIFLQFPDALRPSFPRLKDKLLDEDQGVVCAAVNVICELASKNPQNYISLAPTLFKLLTTSTNNWMLIKVIKLFGSLTELEPRLVKKLVDPLQNLLNTTPAMSLLYECINTVTRGCRDQANLMKLSISKLSPFLSDPDQNLKYLGLFALSRVIETHPKLVAEHKEIILKCIDDPDISIRMRALDLISGLVSKKNIVDIVRKLLSQIELDSPLSQDEFYKNEIVSRIITMCSQNGYQHVTNFEWYLSVLLKLARMEGMKEGSRVAAQLMDVSIRVKVVRVFSTENMVELLSDKAILGMSTQATAATNSEVLYAGAWIAGEYIGEINQHRKVLDALLLPSSAQLPGKIQAVYIQNVLKVLGSMVKTPSYKEHHVTECIQLAIDRLGVFETSTDLEAQERACAAVALLKVVKDDVGLRADFADLFEGELNPVAPKAQRKVPPPEGLDLDAWIHEPLSDNESVEDDGEFNLDTEKLQSSKRDFDDDEDDDVREQRLRERREERSHNPFILASKPSSSSKGKKTSKKDDIGEDEIPIVHLDPDEVLRKEKGGRHRHGRKEKEHSSRTQSYEINRDEGEMPEGATISDDEDDKKKKASKKKIDTADPMNIDLSTPLGDSDQLPTLKAYDSPMDIRKREEAVRKQREEQERRRLARLERERQHSEHKKSREDRSEDRGHHHHHHHRHHHHQEGDADREAEKDSDKRSGQKDKEKDKEKEKQRSGGDKDREKDKEKDKEKEKDRRDRDRDEKKKSASKSSPSSSSSSDKKSEKQPSSSSGGNELVKIEEADPNRPYRNQPEPVISLAKDDNLSIVCDMKVNARNANGVTVTATLTNVSAEFPLSSVELNILDSMNIKLKNSQTGTLAIPHTLQPNQSATLTILFSVDNITVTGQSLRSSATYVAQKSEEDSTPGKLDFKFPFPCSTFVVATPMTPARFAESLADSAVFSAHSKASVELGSRWEFVDAVQAVSKLLHLTIVETFPGKAASLYGGSIQDHPVAVLAKSSDSGARLTIELKSSNDALARALTQEVEKFFQSSSSS